MKYIKTYENKYNFQEIKENFNKLNQALYKLTQKYFEDFNIRMIYTEDNINLNLTFTEKGYFESDDNKDFMKIYIKSIENDNYNIRIEPIYTDIDIYIKTNEFVDYLYDIIKPLSFYNDDKCEYFLYDVEKLISLLSLEYFNMIKTKDKYNL